MVNCKPFDGWGFSSYHARISGRGRFMQQMQTTTYYGYYFTGSQLSPAVSP